MAKAEQRCANCGEATPAHLMAADLCVGCWTTTGAMDAEFAGRAAEARAEHVRVGHQVPHGACDLCFPNLHEERAIRWANRQSRWWG